MAGKSLHDSVLQPPRINMEPHKGITAAQHSVVLLYLEKLKWKERRKQLGVVVGEKERRDDALLAPTLVDRCVAFQERGIIGVDDQHHIEIRTTGEKFSPDGTAIDQQPFELIVQRRFDILCIGL